MSKSRALLRLLIVDRCTRRICDARSAAENRIGHRVIATSPAARGVTGRNCGRGSDVQDIFLKTLRIWLSTYG